MPLAWSISNSATRNGGATLFFTTFDADALADDIFAIFQLTDAADVDAAGGIKLQGAATRRGFGAAEHDADFFADLVDEDHTGFAFGNGAGQLAHGLAHKASLEADVSVAHFAIEFLLRHQGGNGVDDDDVDSVAFDEHFGDVHRFFAAAGLADEERF